MAGGAAVYTYGNLAGSRRAQSYGSQMFVEGFRGATGRSRATYKMSKGLKKSRNRAAKDAYYRDIGTSRKRRNAMKTAAVVGVVAASAVGGTIAKKKGYLHAERDFDYGFVAAGPGASYGYGFVGAGYAKPGGLKLSVRAGSKRRQVDISRHANRVASVRAKARSKAQKHGFVV
jgi:ribosomal protein L20A (L18A)